MAGENVFYCWSCDAHRVADARKEAHPCCPTCGANLTDDSRLTPSRRVGLAGTLSRIRRAKQSAPVKKAVA